jgi:hypothetical protein
MARVLYLCITVSLLGLLLGFPSRCPLAESFAAQSAEDKQLAAAEAQLTLQLQAAKAELALQQKKANKKQKKAAKEELNLLEATTMRQAYLLLDFADADYHGHRRKAMEHLNKAIKNLDAKIAARGTTAEERENFKQEAIRAYYKHLRKEAPRVIESQIISDAQLYNAGQILTNLHVVLEVNNQKRNLQQVNRSIFEIILALGVN